MTEDNKACAEKTKELILKYRPIVGSIRPEFQSEKQNIMEKVLRFKFDQHKDLKQLLLSTSRNTLVENSPFDSYWGCGKDGKGQNIFGKLLMKIRDDKKRLRDDDDDDEV